MTKNEIYTFMNSNPVFHLATVENDQPRVRGMLLFRADEKGKQLRVCGNLELVEDDKLREEIFNHPTPKFLQSWKYMGIDGILSIFKLNQASALEWTMENNFAPKEYTLSQFF